MAKIAYAMYDPLMMLAEKHIRHVMVDGRWTVFYSAWAESEDVVAAREHAALLNDRIAIRNAVESQLEGLAAMKAAESQLEGLVAMKAVFGDCDSWEHPVYCRCRISRIGQISPLDGGVFTEEQMDLRARTLIKRSGLLGALKWIYGDGIDWSAS